MKKIAGDLLVRLKCLLVLNWKQKAGARRRAGSIDHRDPDRQPPPARSRAARRAGPGTGTGSLENSRGPGYVVDQVVPLKRSAANKPTDMQWQRS